MAKGSERDHGLPEYSEFKPVAIGIGIWALLLLGGLVIRHDLEDHGHGWWIWACVAGIVQGFAGYAYLLRRAARAPHETDEPPAADRRAVEPVLTEVTPVDEPDPAPDSRTPDRS